MSKFYVKVKETVFLWSFLSLLMGTACCCKGGSSEAGKENTESVKTEVPDSDQYVLVETNFGNIKLMLYRDTPLHRANFIKLVNSGFYDGQLFFRVMRNFMIQAGDPKSKGAAHGAVLGEGEVDYKIEAEPHPEKYYHKRGALSAATGNPMRESSGSHFFIVIGPQNVKDKALDEQETKIDKGVRKLLYQELQVPYKDQINRLYAESQKDKSKKKEISAMIRRFSVMADSIMEERKFTYTPEQREIYKTTGGSPHLDGYYTVFGEVVEGMEVADSIGRLTLDVRNRPSTDAVIKKMTVIR